MKSRRGWFLVGGFILSNVVIVFFFVIFNVVDVFSGIVGFDGICKDFVWI